MISLMLGIAGGFMVLMLQLALWMIQASIVVGVELGALVVEFIINIICTCFGAAGVSISSRKSAKTKPVVKYVTAKDMHRSLSKRERKEIERKVRKDIKKDQDDLEYDMLMMMEVCADD